MQPTKQPLTAADGDESGERRGRIEALRAVMGRHGLDAVAVSSPENVYYYTGLDHLGYFAVTMLVIPRAGAPVLVARAMERPTLQAQVPWLSRRGFYDGAGPVREVAAALAEAVPDGGAVGLERGGMFFPPALDAQIAAAVPYASVVDVTGLLSGLRAVKSAAEIFSVRRAARFSDLAMAAALGTAAGAYGGADGERDDGTDDGSDDGDDGTDDGSGDGGGAVGAGVPGVPVTDAAVAAQALHAMIAGGGQTPGFVPLVRHTSALDQEHVTWTGRELRPGDGLFVELSGCAARYHAPLSRTVHLGHAPPGAREAHATALAGLAAARRALRPGVLAADVYAAWQAAVAGPGAADGPPLRHHCGYLVGIGFPPSWVGGGEVLGLRADSEAAIRAGMTFHLMSWVTRPVGHVVSDTVLVTPDGSETLTTAPHRLTVPYRAR